MSKDIFHFIPLLVEKCNEWKKNKMKVIQIMDNFIVGGGVNSFVYDLCFALKAQGCDVSLIGILREGYDNNPVVEDLCKAGISVICIGATSKKEAILRYIKKLKEKIVEISGGERGRAQTMPVATQSWGCRTTLWHDACERNVLERTTIEGDSPVLEAR